MKNKDLTIKVDMEKVNKHTIPFEDVVRDLNLAKEEMDTINKRADYYSMLLSLQTARKKKGLTQAELATKSGVPRTTISAIESGKRNATLETLQALAGAMGKRLEIRLV